MSATSSAGFVQIDVVSFDQKHQSIRPIAVRFITEIYLLSGLMVELYCEKEQSATASPHM